MLAIIVSISLLVALWAFLVSLPPRARDHLAACAIVCLLVFSEFLRPVRADAQSRVNNCTSRTKCAYLGDLDQKYDVASYLDSCSDQEKQVYISANAQAAYMREFYPELTPRPPASNHTISTEFECLYHEMPEFRRAYIARKLT